MKVAFTICSHNYLSQALVLADSIVKLNPDYTFYIGIVDEPNLKLPALDHKQVCFLYVQEIGLTHFDDLVSRYNIIELNTCVKASFFKYLFKTHPSCSHIHYFDPDIKLFASLISLDQHFDKFNILLTPHITEPIEDDHLEPRENMFLNYGIYNLGYIGLRNDQESFDLLEWWESHTLNMGYMRVHQGYFVDQLWMNHVPLFFKGVCILRNKGFNCAPWNIHERRATIAPSGNLLFDDQSELIFYHFSSFNPIIPSKLSGAYSRNTFENRPEFRVIYEEYGQELLENGYEYYKKMDCAFYPNVKEEQEKVYDKKETILSKSKRVLFAFIPPILIHLLGKIIPAKVVR